MARKFGPFSGTAKYPELQPIVDLVIEYCRRERISANEFNMRVYGPSASNKHAPTNQIAYKLMHGTGALTPGNAELILEKTGVDLAPYAKPLGRLPRHERLPVVVTKPVKPSARQALVAYQDHIEREPPRVVAKQGPPKFALIVQQDGTASMTMNLLDVDSEVAMRAFDAMKAIGLVKGG